MRCKAVLFHVSLGVLIPGNRRVAASLTQNEQTSVSSGKRPTQPVARVANHRGAFFNTKVDRLVWYCMLSCLPATPVFASAGTCKYPESVQTDFIQRDQLPQALPLLRHSSWGPEPAAYPLPAIPQECDGRQWQRQRIVAVASKYIGLPYRHHHVPGYDGGDGTGLDCSNFTAWVYNYGLGLQLDSAIERQAETAGRRLAADEALQPGDLLFIRTLDDRRISHVAIYIDPQHLIDDHGDGVALRQFKGWYVKHLAYARRVID